MDATKKRLSRGRQISADWHRQLLAKRKQRKERALNQCSKPRTQTSRPTKYRHLWCRTFALDERKLELLNIEAKLRKLRIWAVSGDIAPDKRFTYTAEIEKLEKHLSRKESQVKRDEEDTSDPKLREHTTCPCACQAEHKFRTKALNFEDKEPQGSA